MSGDIAALRADLLELTPEALTALANAGFVKRAQKDVAAGLLPTLETGADGTVQAQFDDGVRTSLPPGRTLRDAQCSCPASGMCRHRVMLVLAYQARAASAKADASAAAPEEASAEPDGAWSPAQFDDAVLAASLAPSVLEQANKLAAARPVVGVQAWRSASAPPVARLPMCSVRFFSRSSLVHARCDCKQGSGCAHVVIAVWAFRQAGALAPGSAEVMVEVQPNASANGDAGDAVPPPSSVMQGEAALALRAQVDALLLSLWLDGSSQPAMALAARFEAVRDQVRAQGWSWVDDALDELWQLLQAQQARSSRFEPLRLLRVLTELWARLQAAAHAGRPQQPGSARAALPASQILGIGVKGEVALDHLRLVSLGAELWSDENAEGASILFADPDTQNVTVLERHWSREGDAAAGGAAPNLMNRRVAGFPLRQLASGQVITKTATRRANGLVDITAGARQTGVLPLSPKSWDDLVAPLRQDSVAALVAHLREAQPDFVRPRQAASGSSAGASGQLHVVAFERMEVASCHWDAAAQVLHARLGQAAPEDSATDEAGADGDDQCLHLALPHRAVSPGAVDALARTLAGEHGPLRAVAGTVHLQGDRVVMQPLALLTAQRAVVLQVEAAAPQPLGLQSDTEEAPALNALAGDTLELLSLWLRQGLRHQSGGALSRAQAQVLRLKQAGLGKSSTLLAAVLENMRSSQRPALVAQLAMLGLLMQGVAQSASA
ncbi:SWIM zinc finger family protein [Variovorax sp. NFACC27]|uniref:SWIM zinc finger family protein n=1 Tax=unclassified Variovorax TaxID=663243 RepID=UPI000898B897|nr:SWIM zinc finger [Variovorax sp. NFACC28]SEF46051.1 SWIM zinc finger [Variovorax sp. NFACC29]SFB66855.1 SWIM zinc finger [Variovorax sp. NFACC26]SFG47552.1 SWIM zinc finger [Variovorax sp. NFACC27]